MIRPHASLPFTPPVSFEVGKRRSRKKRRIAIIGAIGIHKGSSVLLSLAAHVQLHKVPLEIFVIGYTDVDPAIRSFGVDVSGRYASDDEAARRILEVSPDAVFYPSICPETFGYSIDIALRLRIPAIVFSHGAYAERIRELGCGVEIEPALQFNTPLLVNKLMSIDLAGASIRCRPFTPVTYQALIQEYYGIEEDL